MTTASTRTRHPRLSPGFGLLAALGLLSALAGIGCDADVGPPVEDAESSVRHCGKAKCTSDAGTTDASDAGSGDTTAIDSGSSDASSADAGSDSATATTSGTVGPTITTFKPSGPITVTSGQTVTGLAISNPNGPCITGNGVSNVHIYNNKIGPCASTAEGVGVDLGNAHDILVDHNSFDDVAGALYVVSGTNNIVFDHNYATRIRGPGPRGQLVQFNAVTGSGNLITCNVSDQTSPGYLNGTEDHVNIYKSSGTSVSPILIKYNKLRGGGPSTSGGGLMLGDNGGAYTTADTNILVNPGQYGIAIAGGTSNKVLNNKVYSASFTWSNVGIYVWNQSTSAASNEEVSGNRVNWTNKNGVQNSWWDGGNSGTITMSNNVFADPTIGTSIWNETFSACN